MKSYSTTTELRNRIKEREKIPSHVLNDFRQNGTEVYQLRHDESYKPIIEQVLNEVSTTWKQYISGLPDNMPGEARVLRHKGGPMLKTRLGTIEVIIPTTEPKRPLEVVEKNSKEVIGKLSWSTQFVYVVDVDENDKNISREFAPLPTEPIEYVSFVFKK